MSSTGQNLGLLDNAGYAEGIYHEFLRALRTLDALVQPHAISMSLGTPPLAPNEGDTYIVADSATGEWEGHDGQIARWTARSAVVEPTWEFIVPRKNWLFGVDDLDAHVRFDGLTWVPFIPASA